MFQRGCDSDSNLQMSSLSSKQQLVTHSKPRLLIQIILQNSTPCLDQNFVHNLTYTTPPKVIIQPNCIVSYLYCASKQRGGSWIHEHIQFLPTGKQHGEAVWEFLKIRDALPADEIHQFGDCHIQCCCHGDQVFQKLFCSWLVPIHNISHGFH